MLTLNSLSAADSILIPVSVNFLSIEGISQLLDTVMFIKQEINPDVIIVTFYRRHSDFHSPNAFFTKKELPL